MRCYSECVSSFTCALLLLVSLLSSRCFSLDKEFAFSPFASLDSNELAGNAVRSDNVQTSKIPSSMAAQTIFFLEYEPSRIARKLLTWNPSAHKELGIIMHVTCNVPPQKSDFDALNFSEDRPENQWFIKASANVNGGSGDLNLSSQEADLFKTLGRGKDNPAAIAGVWKDVLLGRAQTFLSHGATSLSPYVTGESHFDADAEMKKLLNQNLSIFNHFRTLLEAVFDGKELTGEASYYWEKLNVENQGAINLGVTRSIESNGSFQVMDYQYYVSSSYYSTMILYQIVPATVGGKKGSIVWRGDFVLSPGMANARGVERMFGIKVLIQEVKKTVEYLRNDLSKN